MKIGQIWGYQTSLKKCTMFQAIQILCSTHSGTKFTMNNRKISGKFSKHMGTKHFWNKSWTEEVKSDNIL